MENTHLDQGIHFMGAKDRHGRIISKKTVNLPKFNKREARILNGADTRYRSTPIGGNINFFFL